MRYITFIFLFSLCFLGNSEFLSAQVEESTPKEIDTLLKKGKESVFQNPDQADSLANMAIYKASLLQNDSLIAKSNSLFAYVAYAKGDFYLSSMYYKKALSSSHYEDNLERRQALLNNLGINYEFQQNYFKAEDAYLESLKIARTLDDSLSVYQSHINLGFLYSLQEQFDKSEEFLFSALDYFKKTKDTYYTSLCLRNIANLYVTKKNEEKAIYFFNQALESVSKSDNLKNKIEIQLDFNWALLTFEQFSMLKAQQESIKDYIFNEDMSANNKGTYHMIQGYYYLKTQKNLNLAAKELDRAYYIFKESKNLRQLLGVQKARLELSLINGQLKKHNHLLTEYTEALKENYLAQNNKVIESYENLRKVENQQKEIAQLQNKVEAKSEISILWFSILIIILILLFSVTYFYLKIRTKNRFIFKKNIEMSSVINLLKRTKDTNEVENGTADIAIEEKTNKELKANQNDASQNKFKSSYSEEKANLLFEKIKKSVVHQELYLDPYLKLADIAEEVDATEKEVSKAIADAQNIRFTSFITFFRIKKSKELLTNKNLHDLTIKEVAHKSGFSNQPQFQRKFKDSTGLTPKTYAQMVQNESESTFN